MERSSLLLTAAIAAAALTVVVVVISGALPLSGITGPAPAFPAAAGTPGSWHNVALQDVVTGRPVTVKEYAGRPVLITFLTVACPICTAQQKEIAGMPEVMNGSLVNIGLDVDPSDDPALLRSHVIRNNLTGHYAASPPAFTQPFLDRFGMEILTPASAPMVLVCPDGSSIKFPAGLKPAYSIRRGLEAGCFSGPSQ